MSFDARENLFAAIVMALIVGFTMLLSTPRCEKYSECWAERQDAKWEAFLLSLPPEQRAEAIRKVNEPSKPIPRQ